MSEAQAFVALLTFLEDPAKTQFRTNQSGGSNERRIRKPTINPPTRQLLGRGVPQTFNNSIHRCGNVHEEDEKMELYIDGF